VGAPVSRVTPGRATGRPRAGEASWSVPAHRATPAGGVGAAPPGCHAGRCRDRGACHGQLERRARQGRGPGRLLASDRVRRRLRPADRPLLGLPRRRPPAAGAIVPAPPGVLRRLRGLQPRLERRAEDDGPPGRRPEAHSRLRRADDGRDRHPRRRPVRHACLDDSGHVQCDHGRRDEQRPPRCPVGRRPRHQRRADRDDPCHDARGHLLVDRFRTASASADPNPRSPPAAC